MGMVSESVWLKFMSSFSKASSRVYLYFFLFLLNFIEGCSFQCENTKHSFKHESSISFENIVVVVKRFVFIFNFNRCTCTTYTMGRKLHGMGFKFPTSSSFTWTETKFGGCTSRFTKILQDVNYVYSFFF